MLTDLFVPVEDPLNIARSLMDGLEVLSNLLPLVELFSSINTIVDVLVEKPPSIGRSSYQ